MRTLGWILAQRRIAPYCLYAFLHIICINVTRHDNSLKVGSVPFMIIITKNLVGEVIYNRHQTDGHSSAIAVAVREKLWQGLLVDTVAHSLLASPFFMYDLALGINLPAVEGYESAPVMQYEQT